MNWFVNAPTLETSIERPLLCCLRLAPPERCVCALCGLSARENSQSIPISIKLIESKADEEKEDSNIDGSFSIRPTSKLDTHCDDGVRLLADPGP